MSRVRDVEVRGGGVVEGQVEPLGLEEQKAMLQVSRWLNLVQAWLGQLTVAPLQTY